MGPQIPRHGAYDAATVESNGLSKGPGGVKPHCLHELRETTVAHRGPPRWNSTLEWLLLMPRRHAASILNTALIFDSCTPGQPCCGIARSEDLLSLALARTGRWRHEPFGVDILRGSQHAVMRNAGCMQPDTLGFATFEHCCRQACTDSLRARRWPRPPSRSSTWQPRGVRPGIQNKLSSAVDATRRPSHRVQLMRRARLGCCSADVPQMAV